MPLPETGPELRVYARMATDAYDTRTEVNDPEAPTLVDPDVSTAFAEWGRRPGDDASAARNADISDDSGLDANVYVDEAAGQVVVAFRGTEFTPFLDTLDARDFDLLDAANLTNDVLTLFGYYQDGGEAVENFVEDEGGLEAFLGDVLGLGPDETGDVARLLDAIAFLGGIERLGEIGEDRLRDQAEGAIRATLEAAAANPGLSVTVTGHSLGGALAAYVSAALGVPGVLFDPAPWGESDFLDSLRAFANDLRAEDFPDLDTAALGWDASRPAAETATALTATYRIADSFVPDIYLDADPRDLPGTLDETVIELAGTEDVDPLLLHSPDLHALAVDAIAREDRTDLAALTGMAPGLMPAFDALEVAGEGTTDDLLRGLLVSDPAYALFEDLIERIAAETGDYAPEGSGQDGTAIEAVLLDRALGALGGAVGGALDTGRLDDPGSVAEVFGDPEGGAGADLLVGAYAVPETVRPGAGADVVATGAGARDVIAGSLADLDGDRILDLDRFDRIVIEDAVLDADAVTLTEDGLAIDGDANGETDTRIALDRLPEGGAEALGVLAGEGSTTLAFGPGVDEPGEITLAEARTVALLYEAGLGRPAEGEGLNFWIDEREGGLSEPELAGLFLASPEFAATVGDPDTLSDRALVEGLYENVLDRPGEAAGVAFWTGVLSEGFGRDALLLAFADSPENRAGAEGLDRLAEDESGDWAFA